MTRKLVASQKSQQSDIFGDLRCFTRGYIAYNTSVRRASVRLVPERQLTAARSLEKRSSVLYCVLHCSNVASCCDGIYQLQRGTWQGWRIAAPQLRSCYHGGRKTRLHPLSLSFLFLSDPHPPRPPVASVYLATRVALSGIAQRQTMPTRRTYSQNFMKGWLQCSTVPSGG